MTYRTGSNPTDPLFRPVSEHGYYTAEESEAIILAEKFKRVNGRAYVTITDMLFVLKALGWTMDNEGKKKCTQCGQWKDLDKFHKDNRLKRGHRSECKKCVALRWKNRKAKNEQKSKENNS